MKTTIEIPDEMARRVKILAAERSTTLRNLVLQGLEWVITTAPSDQDSAKKAALARLADGLQATNTEPMKPLTRDELHER